MVGMGISCLFPSCCYFPSSSAYNVSLIGLEGPSKPKMEPRK